MASIWHKTEKWYLARANTPDFQGNPEVIIFDKARDNSDRDTLINGKVHPKNWKDNAGRVESMTAQEISDRDAATLAAKVTATSNTYQNTISAARALSDVSGGATVEERLRAIENILLKI